VLTLTAAWVLLLAVSYTDAAVGYGTPGLSSALDNGTIKVGIDLNAGGSISYLSPSGSSYNLVNIRDKGRYVQQSYYAGQDLDRTSQGQNRMWSPWPWNPIQAGDSYGDSAPVAAFRNDGRTIYVRTRPLLWDMWREQCQCNFETWTTLEGRTVQVRNKLTTFRTDSRWSVVTRSQELPAVYAIADLNRELSYTGDKPFMGYPVTQIPDGQSFWERWKGTENWAACVNGQNFGVGVYSPPRTRFSGGLYGSPGGGAWDDSTCHISPHALVTLDKTSEYGYTYHLTVGTPHDIRRNAYEHYRTLVTG